MLTIAHYVGVISCTACPATGKLLRDAGENVPQPGFVGNRYERTRVLLVGKNPATPPLALSREDQVYTHALRALRDQPTAESLDAVRRVTRTFMESWPIKQKHFSLEEFGLGLDDIAFCNIVRCRTQGNAPLPVTFARTCADRHFADWLDALKPAVVVFIGKAPSEVGAALVDARHIPHDFINCMRSLDAEARKSNRARVAALVKRRRGEAEALIAQRGAPAGRSRSPTRR